MDSMKPLVLAPLTDLYSSDEQTIGGKAFKLAQLARAGYQIPEGFCVTVSAYQQFIRENGIDEKIRFELGRKPFESMRWEEIWDSALRIRLAFKSAEIPRPIVDQIKSSITELGSKRTFVVRSSAPKEDSSDVSFAGLHESYVGVQGDEAIVDSIRLVWASLWSDGALLYQKELQLDPLRSSMAVVVQELVREEVSGLAFGCDPSHPDADRVVIEAVPGLCKDLVDGVTDPFRWLLKKSTGEILESKVGESTALDPLLEKEDISLIYKTTQNLEGFFGWVPDSEWTGRKDRFTLLQVRPVTTTKSADKKKSYYLTLRPKQQKLQELAKNVVENLIPLLSTEGESFAKEDLSDLSNLKLAKTIEGRRESLNKWKKIYLDYFIPFAHGVRYLATYYNDAVRPDDPYEFVGLLKGQSLISTKRNQKMLEMATTIRDQPALLELIQRSIGNLEETQESWQSLRKQLKKTTKGEDFLLVFNSFLDDYMDITYGKLRLKDQPILLLKNIVEMTKSAQKAADTDEEVKITLLEEKLLNAVGSGKKEEALEVLRLGRISWRLRDDDNLLLSRIESQLVRAVLEGFNRLKREGRLETEREVTKEVADPIINALGDPKSGPVLLPVVKTDIYQISPKKSGLKPRQLVGQPAAPGIISGYVRVIRNPQYLGEFRTGEILVCDAIQPNMTHLVPLAGAIIERRGGMLIHGAIIARELGIACVNGIPDVTSLLEDGELVTVDGHLGIVTVGSPEFDMELKNGLE